MVVMRMPRKKKSKGINVPEILNIAKRINNNEHINEEELIALDAIYKIKDSNEDIKVLNSLDKKEIKSLINVALKNDTIENIEKRKPLKYKLAKFNALLMEE